MKPWWFVVFRLCNMLLATTWFVPDEIFQSVEVAYNMVFGHGFLSWEWHPSVALRSAIHPSIYSTAFIVLNRIRLDYNTVINWAPNVLNALLFSTADICYLSFLKRTLNYNRRAVRSTMAFYMFNWFVLYCATRSISNSFETALLLIALRWYKFPKSVMSSCPPQKNTTESCADFSSYKFVLFWALLSILIRPTALLLWLPLCGMQFYESSSKIAYLFCVAFPLGIFVTGFGAFIDFIYYGSFQFTLFNFVQFNVLDGGSAEFGRNPWYWYINNGLPSVLTFFCIPLITKLLRIGYSFNYKSDEEKTTKQNQSFPSRFFWTSIFYIFVHSFIAHKEHRFLLPIIPLMLPSLYIEVERYPQIAQKYFKAFVIVFNIGMALYFGIIHQRGPNAAAQTIANDISTAHQRDSAPVAIFQLMPCFSMPQYARFHLYNNFISIRMLDCTPSNIKSKLQEDSLDGLIENEVEWRDENESEIPPTEDELFHMDSLGWLRNNWNGFEGFIEINDIYHATFLHCDDQDFRIVVAKRTVRE